MVYFIYLFETYTKYGKNVEKKYRKTFLKLNVRIAYQSVFI